MTLTQNRRGKAKGTAGIDGAISSCQNRLALIILKLSEDSDLDPECSVPDHPEIVLSAAHEEKGKLEPLESAPPKRPHRDDRE